MKKWIVLCLTISMIFSMTACGGKEEEVKEKDTVEQTVREETAPKEEVTAEPEAPVQDVAEDVEEVIDLSGYLGTKTGKFYNQFASGKMYMEYETEYDGQKMTVISMTSGDKMYTENIMDGTSVSAAVMEGNVMYTISHADKMVIKMKLGADAQTIAGAIIEESDVDMANFVSGTREIDGKTYETEEWVIEDTVSILCFDGDELAYMISSVMGEEITIKIVEISDKIDESLFEIPEDYMMLEM